MDASQLLAGCRCIACSATQLVAAEEIGGSDFQSNSVRCLGCGATYDVIDGIPYLLVYETRDFLGLVEIAAEFDIPHADNAPPFDNEWPRTLDACYRSSDPEAFKADLPAFMKQFFDDRYGNWCEQQILLGETSLAGKNVLVLGAGVGFDANFLLYRGANITAVDLNPQLNSVGRMRTPRATWLGGLGRHLPFVNSWFDHVFINAALHHVLDVSATILEMIRVVKPGGSVFTTSDSFIRDSTTDLEDARFWNDHVAVLRGINEHRHPLRDYLDPLLANADALDVEIWSGRCFGVWDDKGQKYVDYLDRRRWDIPGELADLQGSAGGELFIRITKKREISCNFEPPGAELIRPRNLAQFIGHRRQATAHLARLMPPELCWPDFPGPPGNTKAQLLSGWRWTEPGELGREAYLSGCWHMRPRGGQPRLHVCFQVPEVAGAVGPSVEISVDGVVREVRTVSRGIAHDFFLGLDSVPPECPFAVQISIDPNSADFSAGLFRVTQLKLE